MFTSNQPNFLREAILRRPLFYAAIVLALLVCLTQNFRESLLPRNSISFKNNLFQESVYVGGMADSGVVSRIDDYGQTHVSFVLKARRFWGGKESAGEAVSGKIKVYLSNPPKIPSYGDEMVTQGQLAAPKNLRNPGGFNQAAFLKIQGIRSVFYADKQAPLKILRKNKGNPVAAYSIRTRAFLSEKIKKGLGEGATADFLKALLLGEREGFDEDLKELFMKTGTIHLLAVSGFNVGFLIAAVLFVLGAVPISKNWKWAAALGAVWFYCLIVGWQAPMLRAAVMASLFILGKFLGRRADLLNTLGLAALVILLISPEQIFDVGFQLSFLAVFAIGVFLPRVYQKPALFPNETLSFRENSARYFIELFWVSFVCQIAVLPVTVQNFYIVTPLSVFANLAAVPISFALFCLGLLFLLCGGWVGWMLELLMKALTASLVLIEHLPGAAVVVGKLTPELWILLTIGICYFFFTPRIHKNSARALILIIFSFNVFIFQEILRYTAYPNGIEITVLDVGQGDSIYMEFPGRSNCLIDAGKGGQGDRGRFVIAPFLKARGVRKIDALVISHPQEDHIGGMPALFDEFKIRTVIEAGSFYSSGLFKRLKEKILSEGSERLVATRGQRIAGFPETQIMVLNPPAKKTSAKNINEDSLVLKILYRHFSFLTTGDIEEKAMEDILTKEEGLKSDVLKVPHHGAKLKRYGEIFVQSVRPQVSVISVGERNPFHHPRKETLDTLSAIPGNQVYRTDQEGAIQVLVNSNLREGFEVKPTID